MKSLVKVLQILAMITIGGESARILAYFPSPFMSHHLVFRALTKELLSNGHEVVLITPHPEYSKRESPMNLTEIDMHNTTNEIVKQASISPETLTGEGKDQVKIMKSTLRMIAEIVVKQLMSDEVQNIIRNKEEKFDLILSEAYVYLSLGFAHLYKVPIMFVSSLGATETNLNIAGAPRHPIYYPDFTQQTVYNHTFLEILNEVYLFQTIQVYDEKLSNKIVKTVFGSDAPTMSELRSVVESMLMLNIPYVWDMNRPVAKNVVFLGGTHLKTDEDLPKDLQDYLDSSKNGVIYVSFGTSVDPATFPPQKLQMLIQVFSKLPYDVLWKWNKDELPGRSKNIRISKWLPQMDLLRHPKVKLFIFQGGLHSTDETISAGVPMLSIPMTSDQWFNSQQIVTHGVGKQVDLESVTEAEITSYIQTLISDVRYKENLIRLRSILHDSPHPPLKRAILWIEYVITHGAMHLRPPSANLDWMQYFEIELVIYFIIVFVILIGFLTFLVRYLYRLLKKLLYRIIKWVKRLFESTDLPFN
nr:uridine diphosphate-glycosyltransferases 33AQ1 [Glyphodes pyloalis]